MVNAVAPAPGTGTSAALVAPVISVIHLAATNSMVAGVFNWRSGALVLRVRAVVSVMPSMSRLAALIVFAMQCTFPFHHITPPGRRGDGMHVAYLCPRSQKQFHASR